MIIDIHTHIFPPAVRKDRAAFLKNEEAFTSVYQDPKARIIGATELVQAMDEEGVDLSVTFGFPWSDEGTAKAHNDYILEAQVRFPNRLVGLSCFNPVKSWAEREAERTLEAGLFGLGELALYGTGFDEHALQSMANLGAVSYTHLTLPTN